MENDFYTQTEAQLRTLHEKFAQHYEEICASKLDLDMSRGKPNPVQLDFADSMLTILKDGNDCKTAAGFDTRNYGLPGGVPELNALIAQLLGVGAENVLIGGNSSLTMMYDAVCRAMFFGTDGASVPWKDQGKIKFLCPAPGYDRHFAICEKFGIEMIPIRMTGHGPDMDEVEKLVHTDASVKGMWCVPKYSNPTGETYDEDTVRRIAALIPAAPDFRIFWDMAYILHDIDETPDALLNIFSLIKGTENENLVLGFFSTSKITYAGGGVAALVSGKANIRRAIDDIAYQCISQDKINQLRHMRYLKNAENVHAIMRRHASVLKPKFDAVQRVFHREFDGCGFAGWTRPHGGYFLSLDVMPGTAKRTVELCRKAGVILTPAGSTYPLGYDPEDKNIRIAPSYPAIGELETAMSVVALCAKLSAAEKLLEKNKKDFK